MRHTPGRRAFINRARHLMVLRLIRRRVWKLDLGLDRLDDLVIFCRIPDVLDLNSARVRVLGYHQPNRQTR
jgi:hypothetical protein